MKMFEAYKGSLHFKFKKLVIFNGHLVVNGRDKVSINLQSYKPSLKNRDFGLILAWNATIQDIYIVIFS